MNDVKRDNFAKRNYYTQLLNTVAAMKAIDNVKIVRRHITMRNK